MTEFNFPRDFLWGASTAAHQVEGNNINSESWVLEYFQRALRCVADCLEAGIDVRGYFCWSAMDNFEWVSRYGRRFGIIEVDRATQKRMPKPSAYWLGNVARSNRLYYPDRRYASRTVTPSVPLT